MSELFAEKVKLEAERGGPASTSKPPVTNVFHVFNGEEEDEEDWQKVAVTMLEALKSERKKAAGAE